MPFTNTGMSLDNFKFSARDLVQLAIYIIPLVVFISALNSKIDTLTEKVNEIKAEQKEKKTDDKTRDQSLINNVNSNTMQLKVLEIRITQLEGQIKSK